LVLNPGIIPRAMPKNMRRLALCGALTTKVMDQKMIALEDLKFEAPKTKQFVEMMENWKCLRAYCFLSMTRIEQLRNQHPTSRV
jgi:large subunit ribosomal protein L4